MRSVITCPKQYIILDFNNNHQIIPCLMNSQLKLKGKIIIADKFEINE